MFCFCDGKNAIKAHARFTYVILEIKMSLRIKPREYSWLSHSRKSTIVIKLMNNQNGN